MSTPAEWAESDPDLLQVDGFDDCLVGAVTRMGQEPVLCYDRAKMIAKLEADGLSHDEAEEHFDFNIAGAWVGERTPCFLETEPP